MDATNTLLDILHQSRHARSPCVFRVYAQGEDRFVIEFRRIKMLGRVYVLGEVIARLETSREDYYESTIQVIREAAEHCGLMVS
jgi:hypothetical protein